MNTRATWLNLAIVTGSVLMTGQTLRAGIAQSDQFQTAPRVASGGQPAAASADPDRTRLTPQQMCLPHLEDRLAMGLVQMLHDEFTALSRPAGPTLAGGPGWLAETVAVDAFEALLAAALPPQQPLETLVPDDASWEAETVIDVPLGVVAEQAGKRPKRITIDDLDHHQIDRARRLIELQLGTAPPGPSGKPHEVPEPASVALFATMLILLLAFHWARRRRAAADLAMLRCAARADRRQIA